MTDRVIPVVNIPTISGMIGSAKNDSKELYIAFGRHEIPSSRAQTSEWIWDCWSLRVMEKHATTAGACNRDWAWCIIVSMRQFARRQWWQHTLLAQQVWGCTLPATLGVLLGQPCMHFPIYLPIDLALSSSHDRLLFLLRFMIFPHSIRACFTPIWCEETLPTELYSVRMEN
jgi:hypothetical protein